MDLRGLIASWSLLTFLYPVSAGLLGQEYRVLEGKMQMQIYCLSSIAATRCGGYLKHVGVVGFTFVNKVFQY